MREEITIIAPKGVIGDVVEVLNYRRRKRGECEGGVWELGKICRVEYVLRSDGRCGYWSYDIVLLRETKSNIDFYGRECGRKSIFLYVSDDKVKEQTNNG